MVRYRSYRSIPIHLRHIQKLVVNKSFQSIDFLFDLKCTKCTKMQNNRKSIEESFVHYVSRKLESLFLFIIKVVCLNWYAWRLWYQIQLSFFFLLSNQFFQQLIVKSKSSYSIIDSFITRPLCFRDGKTMFKRNINGRWNGHIFDVVFVWVFMLSKNFHVIWK